MVSLSTAATAATGVAIVRVARCGLATDLAGVAALTGCATDDADSVDVAGVAAFSLEVVLEVPAEAAGSLLLFEAGAVDPAEVVDLGVAELVAEVAWLASLVVFWSAEVAGCVAAEVANCAVAVLAGKATDLEAVVDAVTAVVPVSVDSLAVSACAIVVCHVPSTNTDVVIPATSQSLPFLYILKCCFELITIIPPN